MKRYEYRIKKRGFVNFKYVAGCSCVCCVAEELGNE